MRTFRDLVITSQIILISSGISSSTPPKKDDLPVNSGTIKKHANPQEWGPNVELPSIPGRRRAVTSSSGRRHSPRSFVFSARPDSPASSSSAQPPIRSRSTSPYTKSPPLRIFGYNLEQLRDFRLIPHSNPNRQFEIRRYTFPRDKPIQLKKYNTQEPMPTEKQTVLSTSDGDVLAILMRSNTYLQPIFRSRYQLADDETDRRVKINMNSGQVEDMTPEEIEESPAGRNKPISQNFQKVFVSPDKET